jgi:hypothetical protein
MTVKLHDLYALTNYSIMAATFVLTATFSQDILDSWFNCNRNNGRNNDLHTSLEYDAVCNSIAINWLLESLEKDSKY